MPAHAATPGLKRRTYSAGSPKRSLKCRSSDTILFGLTLSQFWRLAKSTQAAVERAGLRPGDALGTDCSLDLRAVGETGINLFASGLSGLLEKFGKRLASSHIRVLVERTSGLILESPRSATFVKRFPVSASTRRSASRRVLSQLDSARIRRIPRYWRTEKPSTT